MPEGVRQGCEGKGPHGEELALVSKLDDLVARLDSYQQRHRWLGFPLAVQAKFGDDEGGKLAALIAYYAFFSVFPLLIVATTILGFVLRDYPQVQRELLDTAFGTFIGGGASGQVHAITGSVVALVAGILIAAWTGLGVGHSMQAAMNTVYSVPRVQWPGLGPRVLRSMFLICVVGGGLTLTTILQGVISSAHILDMNPGLPLEVAGVVVGVGLNAGVFMTAFRHSTVRRISWRSVVPGSVAAALAWFVLQKVGTSLLARKIEGAQSTYGTFAVVIGLLFWFYLLAQISMYCAQINLVLTDRLWPRSLRSLLNAEAATNADSRAYRAYATREQRARNASIDIALSRPTGTDEASSIVPDAEVGEIAPGRDPKDRAS